MSSFQLSDEQLLTLRSAPLGSLANKVKLARTLLGLKQGDVADAIGMKAAYLSGIERGDYKGIPIETARPLAEFFGCAIEDLFPAREAVAS